MVSSQTPPVIDIASQKKRSAGEVKLKRPRGYDGPEGIQCNPLATRSALNPTIATMNRTT
jgi:hypothetical protein